jgi:hypothetical protein
MSVGAWLINIGLSKEGEQVIFGVKFGKIIFAIRPVSVTIRIKIKNIVSNICMLQGGELE